mgnify:CR=1 FL=1
MKAPAFDYAKPRTLAEVFALLREHGDDARVLAGGQTLLATLNMRLSEPRPVSYTHLEHAPLQAPAAPHIAHRAFLNSGTWGGSIAYGDPAAEWPCCLVALDGVVHVQGPQGARRIAATDFFQDLYTTALQPDELVTGADLPVAARGDWFGFDELSRRHGDYAVAGLAVAARFDGAVATRVNLGFLGVGATPVRPRRTEALLSGQVLDAAAIEAAAATLKAELDPVGDLTSNADTKRHLASVLLRRLLGAARAGRSALAA